MALVGVPQPEISQPSQLMVSLSMKSIVMFTVGGASRDRMTACEWATVRSIAMNKHCLVKNNDMTVADNEKYRTLGKRTRLHTFMIGIAADIIA